MAKEKQKNKANAEITKRARLAAKLERHKLEPTGIMKRIEVDPHEIGIWTRLIRVHEEPLENIIRREGWKNIPRVPIVELPKGCRHRYALIDGHSRHNAAMKTKSLLPCILYLKDEDIDIIKDGLAPFGSKNVNVKRNWFKVVLALYAQYEGIKDMGKLLTRSKSSDVQIMERKKVLQITSTGVSGDYINEVGSLFSVVKAAEEGIDIWHKFHTPPKKYEERFPAGEYEHVITEENRECVRKIDEDVEKINKLLSENSRDTKKYIELISDIEIQLYGRVRHDDPL